jgi:hypothetical protein
MLSYVWHRPPSAVASGTHPLCPPSAVASGTHPLCHDTNQSQTALQCNLTLADRQTPDTHEARCKLHARRHLPSTGLSGLPFEGEPFGGAVHRGLMWAGTPGSSGAVSAASAAVTWQKASTTTLETSTARTRVAILQQIDAEPSEPAHCRSLRFGWSEPSLNIPAG